MYINSEASKYILNEIIKKKKIDFKKYNLKKYKKEIQKLKKDYKFISKKNFLSSKYKFFRRSNSAREPVIKQIFIF